MLLKKAQYKKVKEIVNRRISDDIYGCDNCKVEIDLNKEEADYLRMTAHSHQEGGYREFQFCSWKCVLEYLPKVKCDYFVSFPFLTYDTRTPGLRAKDFIKLVK